MLQLIDINNTIITQTFSVKREWIFYMPFGELKFKETNKEHALRSDNYDHMGYNLTSVGPGITVGSGITTDHMLTLSVASDCISLTTNDLEERITNLESQVRTMRNIIDNLLRRFPDYAQPNFRF